MFLISEEKLVLRRNILMSEWPVDISVSRSNMLLPRCDFYFNKLYSMQSYKKKENLVKYIQDKLN